MRAHFDETFYRSTQACDLAPGADAFAHYRTVGWRDLLDPAPWFSTAGYLDAHPDVANAQICPFEHYVLLGRGEGRALKDRSPEASSAGPAAQEPQSAGRGRRPRRRTPEQAAARLVDERFYLRMYPDVASSGLTASRHFMQDGWREGRDPNPWFSCSAYTYANPDVGTAQINPFLHWIAAGRAEGRPRGQRTVRNWQGVLSQRPVLEVSLSWSGADVPYAFPVTTALAAVPAEGAERLVVALGSDDYTRNTGGIQACLGYEQQALNELGYDYLYLHPQQALPVLSPTVDPPIRPLLNGAALPSVATSDLADLVRGVAARRGSRLERTVVHGVLGHDPVGLAKELEQLDAPVDYWVHDYVAACSSYALMRNNLDFCGAPPAASGACRLCTHGEHRRRHTAAVAELLDLDDLHVCAPSDVAATTWRAATGYPRAVDVVPHGDVQLVPARRRLGPAVPRVAFVGYPRTHKGWEVFQQVHRWALSTGGLELLHLGAEDGNLPGVAFTHVDGSTPGGMTEALLRAGADGVLLWPTWPETFSLVTFEALAASCLVITHPASGNVAVAAGSHGRALTYPTERRLIRAVRDGSLAGQLLERPGTAPATFRWTGLTPSRVRGGA